MSDSDIIRVSFMATLGVVSALMLCVGGAVVGIWIASLFEH